MKIRIIISATFLSLIVVLFACSTDQSTSPKNSPATGLSSTNPDNSGNYTSNSNSTEERDGRRTNSTTETRRHTRTGTGDDGGGTGTGGTGTGGDDGGGTGTGTGTGGDDGGGTGTSGGSHNAGQNCINCHTGTGEAPKFTLAGTIYRTSAGTQTFPGVTVRFYSGPNASGTLLLTLVSDASGNIHTGSTINLSGGVYPVVVNPTTGTTTAMPVSTTTGGCNASGCHDATTNPRVYVN
jgi:hypothetical protein